MPADLVVYGKIFTSEGSEIVDAFAVKDEKYVYVGGKNGAEAFIEKGKTEIIDYTGKGLVMPSCGNGHAHFFFADYEMRTCCRVGLSTQQPARNRIHWKSIR